MLEKLAPTWLAGVPAIVSPASDSLSQPIAMRRILEAGVLPKGACNYLRVGRRSVG